MRTLFLFLRLTVFYFILFGGVWLFSHHYPELAETLPLTGVDTLLSEEPQGVLDNVDIRSTAIDTRTKGAVWLIFSILGAVVLMIPVSWVYFTVRARSGLDQSLIETMIVLPIAVTGIVLVVKNSLALAFSLAGIVAGVQFRNTLKSTADSLYIFMAVGVGIAGGIGYLSVAALMTMLFNYVFLVLWWLDYGANDKGRRYMRTSRYEPKEKNDSLDGAKSGKAAKGETV